MKKITIIVCFSLFTTLALASIEVATVTNLAGTVQAQFTKGQTIEVKLNQSIPEGATIKTFSKSFVKLLFRDKSEMNLGPSSVMVINSFPKDDPGIITLLRGQIRSQVTKYYQEIKDTTNSKLYIKTRSAAVGVRGTDFQVNFNPINFNTSLITFEGKVAMAPIEEADHQRDLGQRQLLRILNRNNAVMVERGHISAINFNISPKAMIPTLLAVDQLNTLNKQNIDPTKLAKILETTSPPPSDPAGFFHEKTGDYKLPAGSIIDLNTVNIIPPPADAMLDHKSNTFIIPSTFGKIDKETGEYKAPDGLQLGNNGKFIEINRPSGMKLPTIYEGRPDIAIPGSKFAPPPPPAMELNKLPPAKGGMINMPAGAPPAPAPIPAPPPMGGPKAPRAGPMPAPAPPIGAPPNGAIPKLP